MAESPLMSGRRSCSHQLNSQPAESTSVCSQPRLERAALYAAAAQRSRKEPFPTWAEESELSSSQREVFLCISSGPHERASLPVALWTDHEESFILQIEGVSIIPFEVEARTLDSDGRNSRSIISNFPVSSAHSWKAAVMAILKHLLWNYFRYFFCT